MKKAIALLLALAVLGGAAFAQVTTKIALSGTVTIIDQDSNGVFAQDGNGYDTLNFSASKDDMVGFSMTDQNILAGGIELRDWNVWYKLYEGKVKVSFGLLRDATIRLTLPNWEIPNLLGGTDRVTGQGVYTNFIPMDGLTLGLNLPFPTTAEPTADVFQKMDIGAKYVITDLGTVIALANLNLVDESNIINFGFTFSAVENLVATILYKGILADVSTQNFAVGVGYTMDALSAGLEFAGKMVDDQDLAWELAALASYDVNEAISAGALLIMDSAEVLDVSGNVAYAFGNGLSSKLTVGFNEEVYYNLGLSYKVSF